MLARTQGASIAVGVLALAVVGCAGATTEPAGDSPADTSQLRPRGSAYLYDGFDDAAYSRRIWYEASCSPEYYAAATLGTTLRKGYCGFVNEAGNTFKRFVTRPFDTRSASVDWRKGGAEMRPLLRGATASGNQTYYGQLSATTGWDPAGEFYLTAGNRVRYSWDLRVVQDTLLTGGFASSAVLGQFHGGASTTNRAGQQVACGEYNPSRSPSPGLMYETYLDGGGNKKMRFTLFVKMSPAQAARASFPVPVGSCVPGATFCLVDLWQGDFDYGDFRGQWASVSYIFTISPDPAVGRLEFFFGVANSTDADARYQRRLLSSRRLGAVAMATRENDCPSNIFLGMYTLGYPERYYGTHAERDAYGAAWVDPDFTARVAELGGTAPQLVVDYDNFRIVQE